jgi:hypothetical protein
MEADGNEQCGDRSTEYTFARLVRSSAGGTDATSESESGPFSEHYAISRCRRVKVR